MVAIFFLIPFLGGVPCFASEGTEAAAPFIWLVPGDGVRLPDGRMEQAVTLEAAPAIAVERPEIWVRIRKGRGGEAIWRKGDWSSADPWTLIIQSGEYVTADVFAEAEIEGRPHFAQTRLILYGQAKEVERDEESGEGPRWPEFRVRSNGESYWPQTGHEFSVSFSGEENGYMEIRNGRGELLDEVHDSGEGYTYTPAHDPALNRAGTTASKPLLFVVRINEGGSASYTQIVHRSRFAGMNKQAGLSVFAAAFALSGLTVILTRRKAQPWY